MIPERKNLATWFKFNIDVLSQHNLFGTCTTAKILNEVIDEYIEENSITDDYDDFSVTQLLSGSLGGDQIIGGMIAEGKIDVLIFFCDNLITFAVFFRFLNGSYANITLNGNPQTSAFHQHCSQNARCLST